MIPIGGHQGPEPPLVGASERGADLLQMFIADPQSWEKPAPRPDAEELRSASLPIYVHAPYPINVVSPNNRIRIPSRKTLANAAEAAQDIGAAGLIVHGGHVEEDESTEAGFERWQKALAVLVDFEVPVFIENTAGGANAVAREVEAIARFWEVVGDAGVGFCLDTCHAWAAGEDLTTIVPRLFEATGRIDLVHCNDSRDPFGSRRDRHTNLGAGEIPPDQLIAVVQQANAPVVVETPGGAAGQREDIEWLRRRLTAG